MYASSYAGRLGPRSQHAYSALKQRILQGEFPLTQRLAEETLAAELGVSRTPVHEALTRLHAERLVERNPQGGFYPSAPDLVEVRELYEVRRALEADAIARPGRTGEPHDRDELLALRDDWQVLEAPAAGPAGAGGSGAGAEGADPEFVLLDEEFHVRLAHAAGNVALAELLVQVNERIRPVRTQDFLTGGRIATTIEQHLGVIGALLAGDERLAARLLGSHIAESMDVVEQRVATAFARMSTRSDPRRSRAPGGAGGTARPRPPAPRRRR